MTEKENPAPHTHLVGKPADCLWDCVDAPMDVCPMSGKPCPSPAPWAEPLKVKETHPLAKFGSPDIAPLGLYRVHWKSGGSSLASIGMMENGDRWIAPTNWVKPWAMPTAGGWGEIDRLEPIEPPPETRGRD